MITSLIQASRLILTHLLTEMKMILLQISPIREPVINLDVHNPLRQRIRETEPVTNLDLHTPLPSNKKDHFQHDQQQIINRLEAQISALKSHLKCEVSTMNSRIDLYQK